MAAELLKSFILEDLSGGLGSPHPILVTEILASQLQTFEAELSAKHECSNPPALSIATVSNKDMILCTAADCPFCPKLREYLGAQATKASFSAVGTAALDMTKHTYRFYLS
jgi:hypothetical protein